MQTLTLEEAIDAAKQTFGGVVWKGAPPQEYRAPVSENWTARYWTRVDVSGFTIFSSEGQPVYEFQSVKLPAGIKARGRSGYDSKITRVRRETGTGEKPWIVFENSKGKDVFGLCDVTREDMDKIMSLLA